ncbi:YceD family protein [Luteipulveratus sp. YIM 133132]|uniref:YceD family protein n=1 Tax=Luteipulveratus flavus TaxID=3031728 RepID=A0ABT6C4V7_9MICO|nr:MULTISPECIES: YceD family protein [unclassified Luteipulveratus]MDE9367858.1 YceD family protein [Luteipulveratus sp. YIM 133132]MDF8263785.1 YceD family protein [Luteipulveratus sp. YIM 133296]
MTPADTRRPLVLDTRELGRRPGQMVELQRTVEAPSDLGTDVIAVPEGQPIELDLRLESVMEGVLISGSARATATGACVRCLDDVHLAVDVPVQELFAYADRAAHHHEVAAEQDDDDLRELDGDFADLEPVLRDAVVPALPFQPVCREDCPGLCSECGARLADDPDHHHEKLDPRWGALAALSDQDASDDEKKRN